MTGPEKKFLWTWKACHGPDLQTELRFLPGRRWAFDFAHPQTRTAFEIEGGSYISGRHTRGIGFLADCHKYNAALLGGWAVFRLTPEMVTTPYVTYLIAFVIRRALNSGSALSAETDSGSITQPARVSTL